MGRSHPIAEGGNRYNASPGEFFTHAAAHLLGQIDGVIFIHGFQKRFDQNGGGVIGQLFCDGDDADSAVPAEHGFIEDAVLTAAGKAGEFPDKDQIKGTGLLLCQSDHLHKGGTSAGGASADSFVQKNEVFRKKEPVALGIFLYFLSLAVGGILNLVFGGDADIGCCGLHGANFLFRSLLLVYSYRPCPYSWISGRGMNNSIQGAAACGMAACRDGGGAPSV